MISDQQLEETVDRLIVANEAADALLMSLAKGGVLSPRGTTLLRSVGIDNKFEIERHVSRLKSIVKHQQKAGTVEERDSLAKQRDKAKAKLEAEVPAIRKELDETVAKLQSKIDKLQTAYDQPAEKLGAMEAAVVNLQSVKNLPQFVQDRFGILKSSAKERFHDVTEAKSAVGAKTETLELVKHLESLSRPVRKGDGQLYDLVKNSDLQSGVNGADYTVDAKKVQQFKGKLELELKNAQAVIDARDQDLQGELGEAEEALNYYVL